MLNGNAGWSQKGNAAGEASYYYSYPRLVAKGAVSLARGDYEVTGNVWMDHEFGSAQLAANQIGWDWIGLQLNTQSGAEVDLMSFNLRDANGRYDPHSAGTLRVLYDAAWRGHDPAMREGLPSLDARPQSRFAGGASQKKAAEPPNSRPFDWAFHAHSFTFTPVTYWRSPHTGANYPIGWHFEIPQRQLKLDIHASVADQELLATATGVEYWEGAVDVTGSLAGETLSGSGYLEMTGYARPFEALRRR
jgi:predicted secreted hydrolase